MIIKEMAAVAAKGIGARRRGSGKGWKRERESWAHLHKVKRNRGRRKTAADIVKTQARAVLTNSYSNTQSSARGTVI